MRKYYIILWSIIAFLLASTEMNAQIVYALQEGFEAGIPGTWTQQNIVGTTNWVVEQGGTYPNGAAGGTSRAVLRNNTQQTQGFVTKLISPVMDLTDVYQPILVFSHAQEHRLGDVDELRVYYRPSTTASWVLLEEYTDRIRNWDSDTVRLVGVTATYQIAFEGTDKFGRGIVLDNIGVRPMPVCTQPVITVVSEPTSVSFNLHWTGSFDADSSALRISTTSLDDMENAEGLVLDTIIASSSCFVSDLTPGQNYYCYVKTFCVGESSEWSNVFSYRTKATVNLPYTQLFNSEYNSAGVTYLTNWTWKNSYSSSLNPYINTSTRADSWANYSRTATTCVVIGTVPAGQWAYLASPEIITNDISAVQVSFWGTSYDSFGNNYASSLIVGVMTDPEDFSSFVPVDTATIEKSKTFKEFIIDLDSYSGTGKYIAFASNFHDKDNIFYLDDVVIKPMPDCSKISEVKVSNIKSTTAKISVDMHNASQWTLAITKEAVSDITQVDPSKIVLYQENITTPVFDAPGLISGSVLYVYAKASCEGAEWSNVVSFRTECAGGVPMFFGFEEDEGLYSIQEINPGWSSYSIPTCLYTGTSQGMYPPHIQKNAYARTGDNSLYLRAPLSGGGYGYVAFPEIENIQEVQISFWIRLYGSSESYLGTSHVIVGIMSDRDDISTFDSIASFKALGFTNESYMKCEVSFQNYQGTGKYIAFKQETVDDGVYRQTMIDDVLIEEIQDCPPPFNIRTVDITGESALLTWEPNGIESFRLVVDTLDMTGLLAIPSYKPSVLDSIVKGESFLLENLKATTQYYVMMLSVCDETTSSLWQDIVSFKTTCAAHPLPFSENFEDYTGESSVKEIPLCWETMFATYSYLGSISYYPRINSSTDAYSGSKSLYLSSSTSSPNHADYVALPLMDAPIEQLQVSFMLRQSSVGYRLEVGVISDPMDTTTFVPVRTITATNETRNIYQEITIPFDAYTGDGQYIMFRSPRGTNSNYIDNVRVDYVNDCQKPTNLRIKDIGAYSANLYWDKGGDETMWKLIVLTTDTVLPGVAPDSIIAFLDTVYTNSHIVPDLDQNTSYYYYLQSICGEISTDWTLNRGTFITSCITQTSAELGVEDFESYKTAPPYGFPESCWEMGLQSGTIYSPQISDNSGSRRLHFWNTTASYGAYAIMPPIDIDSINRLKVTFTGYTGNTGATNEKKIVVGVITNTADFASFVPIDTVEVELNDPRDYAVSFDSYKGDYNMEYGKRIIFYSPFGSVTTNYVYVDNVRLDTISPCPEPTKVWADSIGTYGAHITWNGNDALSYRVKVSSEPLSVDDLQAAVNPAAVVCDSTVVGTGLNVDGLEMLATYYMYVQTVCSGNEYSDWSLERRFKTQCPVSYPLPYKENFDSYGVGSTVQPSCWSSYYGTADVPSTTVYPYVNASYNNTTGGKGGLYFYSVNTSGYYNIAASPALDIDDISKVQVSFFARNTTATYVNSKLIVGLTTTTDSLTLSSFLPVDTICPFVDFPDGYDVTNWYKYKYDFSFLADDTLVNEYKYLVFAMDRELNLNAAGTSNAIGQIAIDNLEIELIPTCQKPEYLTVGKITTSTLDVYWTDTVAGSWNIQYGPKGFELGNGTIITADISEQQISELTPGVTYDIYVQSDCGAGGGLSPWEGPLSATTKCLVEPVNAIYGFEESDGWVQSLLSTSDTYKLPGCWVTGSTLANATGNPYNAKNSTTQVISKTGDYGLRMFLSSTYLGYAYAIMPELNADLDTIQLHFSARALNTFPANHATTPNKVNSNYTVAGMNPHIIVGTVEDQDDFSTFERLVKVDLSRWESTTIASEENNWLWDDIVLPLYGVKGKYITFAVSFDEEGRQTYYTYLDDVFAKKESVCAAPININFGNYNNAVTSADLTWRPLGSLNTSWSVKVLTEEVDISALAGVSGASVVYDDVVNTPFVEDVAIEPYSTYYVYIRSNCESDTTNWVLKEIKTPCVYNTLGAIMSFEEEGGYVTTGVSTGTGANYLAPDCWIVGNKSNSTYAYIPYRIKDRSTTSIAGTGVQRYSRSNVDGNALKIYSSVTTTVKADGAYAIMPAYEGDADTLQLHFHARAAFATRTETPSQGYKISTTHSSQKRSIVVGTVTDRTDINTFVPLDTVVLSALTTSQYANEENNWLFDEIIIPLTGAKGKHVAFLSDFGATNTVYLDDITIEPLSGCFAPRTVSVGSITSTASQVNWTLSSGGDKAKAWVIAVARNEDMTSIVRQDTVYAHAPHPIDGLSPATNYYVSVQQLCVGDDDTSSPWSTAVGFTTARRIIFSYNFDDIRHNPIGWNRYNTKFDADVMNTANLTPTTITVTGSIAGWVRNGGGNGLATPHTYVTVYGTSSKHWLVTPLVEIPSEPTWLTFDLALTGYNTNLPVISDQNGDDDRFVVVVSDDGGLNWKKENAVEWNNAGTGDYVFDSIANAGERIQIDLSAYAGKYVKVGFYAESTAGATALVERRADVHIDNVRINRFALDTIKASVGQGHDYTDRLFDITYDKLELGENEFEYWNLSSDNQIADSLITLKLSVNAWEENRIADIICEGYPYNQYNFIVTKAGTYKQKLTSIEGGDSLIILDLSFIPSARVNVFDTICHGLSYHFNGVDYNRSGLYIDTLQSRVTGCDSIVSLYLRVNDAIRSTVNHVLCYGDTYVFDGREITQSGTYIDTLQTAIGCDSIVTLHLSAKPLLRTVIHDVVCPGETYTGYGFIGVPAIARDYERTETTSDGCDSTIVLRLAVLTDDITYLRQTIGEDDLPYTFYGKTYPVGTAQGTYTETTENVGSCNKTVIAELTIGEGSGVDNRNVGQLLIAPSLIQKGESVRIIMSPDDISHGNMRVEVYDMMGRVIYNQDTADRKIEINNFPTSGVYVIKVTTADSKIKLGRVVVK